MQFKAPRICNKKIQALAQVIVSVSIHTRGLCCYRTSRHIVCIRCMLFVIGMAKGKECKIQCIRTSCVSLIPMPKSLFCSNVIASIEDLSMQRQRSFTYLTYQKPDIIHNMWDLGKLFLFKNFSTPKSFLLTLYMDFLGYF